MALTDGPADRGLAAGPGPRAGPGRFVLPSRCPFRSRMWDTMGGWRGRGRLEGLGNVSRSIPESPGPGPAGPASHARSRGSPDQGISFLELVC